MIGTWTDKIGCGNNFNIVCLYHAKPQDIGNTDDLFSNYIYGWYDKKMSDGKTKFLISIGGDNSNWDNFQIDVNVLYKALKFRGLAGIDFNTVDIDTIPYIINLSNNLKEIDDDIIIQITHQPDVIDILQELDLTNINFIVAQMYSNYNYLDDSNTTSKKWSVWADILLRIYGNKLFLAFKIDSLPIYDELTARVIAESIDLIIKYNGAGLYFWKSPHVMIQKCIAIVKDFGRDYFDVDNVNDVNDVSCIYQTGAFFPFESYPCSEGDKFCKPKYYGNVYRGATKGYCNLCANNDYRAQKQSMCFHNDMTPYSPIATSVETFGVNNTFYEILILVIILALYFMKN